MTRRRPIQVSTEMSNALAAFRSGDTATAKALLSRILKIDKANVDANHLAGYIALGAGDFRNAIALISRALSLNPKLPQAHNNLGEAFRGAERFPEAEASYRRALALDPSFFGAMNNLGVALEKQGRVDEAIPCFQQALQQAPRNADILINLGNALVHQENTVEAAKCYQAAIAASPKDPRAHIYLADQRRYRGHLDEAIAGYRHALSLDRDNLLGMIQLGVALVLAGELEEAVAVLEKAQAAAPGDAEIPINLGKAELINGDAAAAIAHYRRALAIEPGSSAAHCDLAIALLGAGSREEALTHFRASIAADEENTESHRLLSNACKHATRDDDILQMEEIYQRPTLGRDARMHLCFGLGKAHEDLKDYPAALRCFAEGNALKRASVDYDIAWEGAFMDRLKAVFTADFLATRPRAGNRDATPIFIVGMPRSGTSLVEQILASHSRVHGGGELRDMMQINRRLHSGAGAQKLFYPESLRELGAATLDDNARRYVAGIRQLAPDAPHVSDKLPQNFAAIGLIHLMLPGAKIVHIKRDPVDNCLSLFKNYFPASNYYSCALDELARYYQLYEDLMRHWQKVLPGGFHEIGYEALVDNQEAETRAMLDYCGLDFEPACLEFHKTDRLVSTVSMSQVRNPIYRDSVDLWRRYGDGLAPLVNGLAAGKSA